MRNLQLCPVCKEKHLVGRHKTTCAKKHPIKWIDHHKRLLEVEQGRIGRVELMEKVASARD